MSLPIRFRHRGRKVRKDMDQFCKDHAFNGHWFRPHKLRKVHLTKADCELLCQARDAAAEAGRLRMVARGLYQYAKPGELTPEQEADWAVKKAAIEAGYQAARDADPTWGVST